MRDRVLVIGLSLLLDAALGDPENPYHPIRLIGMMIAWGVRRFRRAEDVSAAHSFVRGMLLSLGVVACAYLVALALVKAGGLFAEVALCYFCVAAKALRVESMRVHAKLMAGDIPAARKALSYIVGRDTERLDCAQIVQATVETVAENLSDGVIAPLFYVLLGGVPLGFAYKAVNTLDSMIGYRNEAFLHFGKFAARLDDAANWVPARMSALLMLAATLCTGDDFPAAARVYLRDRRKHSSPNSGQTESVCAGALGLRLGGTHAYGGIMVEKPSIGDPLRQPEPRHIAQANRLMTVSTLLLWLCMAVSAAIGGGTHG